MPAEHAAGVPGVGEPQIVNRNGEERVYIPIDRGAAGAGAAAGGDDKKPAYSDDKKPEYSNDNKVEARKSQKLPAAGGARGKAGGSGGGPTQTRGKRKPTYAKMAQVGLDELQPARGFTLEQWVFEGGSHGNTPLVDSGALQVDFAIDAGGGTRKKVVLGEEGAPELARVLGLMALPEKRSYFDGLGGGNGFFRMDLVALELGQRGAAEIARPLGKAARATGLKELHFEFNQFGDEGALTIVKALKDSDINALHLSENEITDAGIAALVPHLLELRELSILFIGGNRFGDKGVRSLADFAMRSVSLTGIRVSGCYDEEGFYIEPSGGALEALGSIDGVELDR